MINCLVGLYEWAKGKCPQVVFHSAVIFVFSQSGAAINFVTNLLIVPNYLNNHELGLIAPVINVVALGALPLSVVAGLIIKYVTMYEANMEWGKLKRLIRDMLVIGALSNIVTILLFIIGFKFFSIRVGIKSGWILFWMLAYLFVSSWMPVVGLLVRATQRFFITGLGMFVTPVALMLSAVLLLPVYGFEGYLVALIIATTVNVSLSAYSIYKYFKLHDDKLEPYFADCGQVVKKYILLFFISGVVGWLWGLLPPFVVKHFLSDQDAAGYFFVNRLSHLPFYSFSTLMIVLLPILSMKHEKNICTAKTVKGSVVYTVLSGIIVISALYVFSPIMFDFVPQWRSHASYSSYIWLMAVSVTLSAVSTIVSADLMAKWVFKPVVCRIPVTCFYIILTYCLFGWNGVRGYIPESIWVFVDTHIERDIKLLILILIASSLSYLLINIAWYVVSVDGENKRDFK